MRFLTQQRALVAMVAAHGAAAFAFVPRDGRSVARPPPIALGRRGGGTRRPFDRSSLAPRMMTSMPELFAACTLPTLIGFWKREYGVSYAYGSAIALSASLVLAREQLLSRAATLHAVAHLLYGMRLCAFLGWRELSVPRFREMRERIEARAEASERGGSTTSGAERPKNFTRLSSLFSRFAARAPFILGCSFLYWCMSVPLVASARGALPVWLGTPLLGAAYAGLACAAIGDFHKSWAKARRGPDALVTSGLYGLVKHPNYTGEGLLWAASALAGAAATTPRAAPIATLGTLIAIAFGQLGIQFVLAQATTGLNKRQADKYGDTDAYQNWRAFKGFELPKKKNNNNQAGDAPAAVDGASAVDATLTDSSPSSSSSSGQTPN